MSGSFKICFFLTKLLFSVRINILFEERRNYLTIAFKQIFNTDLMLKYKFPLNIILFKTWERQRGDG